MLMLENRMISVCKRKPYGKNTIQWVKCTSLGLLTPVLGGVNHLNLLTTKQRKRCAETFQLIKPLQIILKTIVIASYQWSKHYFRLPDLFSLSLFFKKSQIMNVKKRECVEMGNISQIENEIIYNLIKALG